jgi:hypothetical protein
MTKLDLRPAEVRNELGMANNTVSQPSLFPHGSGNRKPRQEHRPLDHTKRLIYDAVADCGKLSRLDIARLIHRAKTPHLCATIDSMVTEGYLIRHATQFRNDGVWKYEYEVAER